MGLRPGGSFLGAGAFMETRPDRMVMSLSAGILWSASTDMAG
jgi:hypothetical protein